MAYEVTMNFNSELLIATGILVFNNRATKVYVIGRIKRFRSVIDFSAKANSRCISNSNILKRIKL